MQIRLFSNGLEVPVSPFVRRYIANIGFAITESLKAAKGNSIRFEIVGDSVRLEIDGCPVSLGLNQGFAETLVRDTLQGMTRHLKGMESGATIRIEIDKTWRPAGDTGQGRLR